MIENSAARNEEAAAKRQIALTAKLRIFPDEGQQSLLLSTMAAYQAACN